jgi:hypothetical protein
MGKLQLTFSGRRTNQEEQLGAFIRVNLNNGNTIISKSVVDALGLQPKSKLNVAKFGDTLYFGENAIAGYALDKNCKSTTSQTLANEVKAAFKDEIGEDHAVVILAVDVENVEEAEDQEGNPTNVVALSFLKSQPARKVGEGDDDDDESGDDSDV